jgi:aldehyde dehydrogenase (NAD+)
MRIMQEEIFGPVLPVMTVKSAEEIPPLIAKRPKPLALYIYATDKSAIDYYLSHTTSGSCVVNNNCVQSGTNPHLPFGGVGESGMGRIGGFRGFEEMSNARSVMHQPLDKIRDMLIQLPPYSSRYEGLIMKALKK